MRINRIGKIKLREQEKIYTSLVNDQVWHGLGRLTQESTILDELFVILPHINSSTMDVKDDGIMLTTKP